MKDDKKGTKLSRRSFLKGLGGSAIGTVVISTGLVKSDPAEAYSPEIAAGAGKKTTLNLKVNGKNYRVEVEHRNTLAKVLRDQLELSGPRSVATAASAAPARCSSTARPPTPA